jgi:hypothetical protein
MNIDLNNLETTVFLPADIYLVDCPFSWRDPISWFAAYTKWACRSRGEEPTRDLWHAGLIIDDKHIIEIKNGSFNALQITCNHILEEKYNRNRNLVVFRFPWFTEGQRLDIVSKAINKVGASFNHLCILGFMLSQIWSKIYPTWHWGWPERHIRYGFVCVEFVQWCLWPHINFRTWPLPLEHWINHWQGCTNDDIVDWYEYQMKYGMGIPAKPKIIYINGNPLGDPKLTSARSNMT